MQKASVFSQPTSKNATPQTGSLQKNVGEVDDIISTQELYNSYKMFCEDHNAPIQTQEHFLDTIDRAFPAAKRTRIRIGTARLRGYEGLCYKNSMEAEYETI